MTVAEIDALLYLPGRTRERLAARPAHPGAQPGMEDLPAGAARSGGGGRRVGDRQPGADRCGQQPAAGLERIPAAQGRRRRRPRARSIFSFRLAAADGAAAAAGACRASSSPSGWLRRPVRRRSSAATRSPAVRGRREYRISVKREAHGAASTYLHTHVHAGDTLDVAAPRGSFTLRAGDAPVLLLSAGVGATPVLAMLHQLVAERSTRAGLVAARRARRQRASVRRGGAGAGRGAAARALARLVQPPGARRRAGTRLRDRGPAVHGPVRPARRSA